MKKKARRIECAACGRRILKNIDGRGYMHGHWLLCRNCYERDVARALRSNVQETDQPRKDWFYR